MATSEPSLPGQISCDDDTGSWSSTPTPFPSPDASHNKLETSSRAFLFDKATPSASLVTPPPLPVNTSEAKQRVEAKPIAVSRMESLEKSPSTGIGGRIAEAPDEDDSRLDGQPALPNASVENDQVEVTAGPRRMSERSVNKDDHSHHERAGAMPVATGTPNSPHTDAAPVYRRQTLIRTNSQSRMGNAKSSHHFVRTPSDNKEPDGAEQLESQVEEVDGEELTFVLPELSKDGDDTGRTVRETWPVDHVMLLYMLSRYAVCARSAKHQETWIRQTPLLVLIYEGIAAGALNFDYAPAATVIAQDKRPKRIWMNITQDGKSAIDDLREANLINGLKLSTKDYHSVTAFQVSTRGLQLLEQVNKDVKARVDAFIFAPKPYRRELLTIRYIPIKDPPETEFDGMGGDAAMTPSWTMNSSSKQLMANRLTGAGGVAADNDEEPEFNEEGRFILESVGYFRYSEVTETEDVSYVSSPFVPHCVRGADAYQQLSSNAHRAQEAAGGQSNIRDTLSEAIILANPVCLIGEWIPFGSNQIVALNERLGSMDRCQGGLFTSLIDDRPTDTQFEVPPGLTEVRILDYDPVRYINFEAEINFPEDDGIVQVENFGIHLNVDGTIFYGIKVDAILDKRSDRVSVDLLSRLLVDIHQDSSEIMDDLLSSYQTSLLDMVFLGDIANRGKFNMIMADQIDPFIPGLEYMDRDDFENELKQVLGDIHCAYDIGEDSVLIVGRDGMLIAGSASKRFEKFFVAYFSLLCREMFLRSFFTRIFVLEEHLKETRDLIFCAKEDPNHLATIRSKLNQATNDLILFADTLGYLLESLEFVKIPQKSLDAGEEEEAIYSYLDLKKQHHDILLRARDLEKLVHGAKYEVINLRQMAEVLNTSELEDIFKTVESNTKVLADSSLIVEKSGASLELIQLLLAGSFALTVMDRLPGGTLNVEVPTWVERSFAKIVDVPMLFFVLSILWMALCIAALVHYKKRKNFRDEFGRRTIRVKANKSIRMEPFEKFLGTRELDKQESVSQLASEVRRVVWRDAGLKSCGDVEAHSKSSIRLRSDLMSWKQRFRLRAVALWKRVNTLIAAALAPTASPNTILPGTGPGSATSLAKQSTILSPGIPVEIEIEYDSRHGFLLLIIFRFHYDETPPGEKSKLSTLWETITRTVRPNKSRRRIPREEGLDRASKNAQIEQELMTWFATEMKNHKVIDNIDVFMGSQ